jgi:luciferase family oxidoreductase group 1
MTRDEVPLSILDLAIVGRNDSVADALAGSVAIAQAAEARGYRRIWYAEHHNMSSIASAATAVLIAHIAAKTDRILLGSGGVMLPNHSPLAIAEQFGTLASLHPGRIELGLGRAPGSDQASTRALRADPRAAASFPQDVVELQAYLAGESIVAGVNAIPGAGTKVPLTILGSSLFGAELAAHLGLPYGFASHFAPTELQNAVSLYRRKFQPSEQLDQPHVMAAVNVVIAPTEAESTELFGEVKRQRVASFLGRGRQFAEDELDQLVESPQGRQIAGMMRYTAVGTPAVVRSQLDEFREHADADELIVVHNATTAEGRVRSVHLVADAYDD